MRNCFAYIRVSTTKQGEHGVSLHEQRSAIELFAQRNGLEIVRWFEERETAAKRGRPVFTEMLSHLKKGEVNAIVIHKIDRGARNLRDWADLGELIDQGADVYFANEGLDLHSRGGRLSADIQAVVAADYIRNLREETRKGFYGRLKQGLYPLPAPVGYADQGKGKAKIPDPVQAPLVRKAFELYATGRYGLWSLGDEMFRRGLRNRNGNRVSMTGLSGMLNNTFYMGVVTLRRTNETYQGIHQAIVPARTFKAVQRRLRAKNIATVVRHDFQFRRLLKCASCGYSLIGERQKGNNYYRCHTRTCPMRTIREEAVHEQLLEQLAPLRLHPAERAYLGQRVKALRQEMIEQRDKQLTALSLTIEAIDSRVERLTDVYIDNALDRDDFEQRKRTLLLDRRQAQEQLDRIKDAPAAVVDKLEEFLELADVAQPQYKIAEPDERRDLLEKLTSNRLVYGKYVSTTMKIPFDAIAKRDLFSNGAPFRDRPRTFHEKAVSRVWDSLIVRLVAMLSTNDGDNDGADTKRTA